MGAGPVDGLSDRLTLVAPEIVHNDHVATRESGCQGLFDVGQEPRAVHGTVQHQGCSDGVLGHQLNAVLWAKTQGCCLWSEAPRRFTSEYGSLVRHTGFPYSHRL